MSLNHLSEKLANQVMAIPVISTHSSCPKWTGTWALASFNHTSIHPYIRSTVYLTRAHVHNYELPYKISSVDKRNFIYLVL